MQRDEFLKWAVPITRAVLLLVQYAPGGGRATPAIDEAIKVLRDMEKYDEDDDDPAEAKHQGRP